MNVAVTVESINDKALLLSFVLEFYKVKHSFYAQLKTLKNISWYLCCT